MGDETPPRTQPSAARPSPAIASPLSRRAFFATTATAAAGALGLIACADEVHGTRGDAADDATTPDAATPDATTPDATTPDSGAGDLGPADAAADTVPDAADAEPDVDAPADVPPPRFDPDTYPEASESTFPIGVGASDPSASGIVLASRYAGVDAATALLELVVWRRDADGDGGALVLRQPVTLADGGFLRVDVSDLAPGADHSYAFVAGQRRSPVGRFRTAPAPTARPVVTLGATSCAKWDFRPFDVLARAAEVPLDAFLLLGDTTYADDAVTLAEYRDNWGRNLGTSEYRALRQSTATAATWDDHEVANNWDPETIDPTRLATARQAFFEHMAPRRDPATPDRIWRALTFGETVEVFLLDCRSERRPSTRDTAQAEYISEAQLSWLTQRLADSRAVFKVVVSSVPITNWPIIFPGQGQRWEGYAAQRERVLAMTESVPGLVWLAGDFHFAAVAKVDPPGGAHAAQDEILVGPVAHLNPGLALVQLGGSPQQFPWLSGDRNFGRLTFDPTTTPPRLTVEHLGTSGAVLHTAVLEP